MQAIISKPLTQTTKEAALQCLTRLDKTLPNAATIAKSVYLYVSNLTQHNAREQHALASEAMLGARTELTNIVRVRGDTVTLARNFLKWYTAMHSTLRRS